MPEQFTINTILKDYQNKIYWLALSISRNENDAEDILQNTLIKIMRKLSTFKSRSQLSTWIYRVAYNESLMYLRKRRRLFNSANAYNNYNKRLPAGLMVNWLRIPDKELLDKELKARIDSALKNIPLQYRMPLLLHRLEGFSLTETSRIIGIKSSTVKTRLHRAYLMIKDQMRGYFNDLPEPVFRPDARCSIWTGFLFDYVHEKLAPERKESFNQHIQDCARCNNFLDTYLKAIRITGALDCRDLPGELKDKLETFFLSSKKD